MVQRIGEVIVTCFILAIIWVVTKPFITRFRMDSKYGAEMLKLQSLYQGTFIYIGQNDSRFPVSISDYDRYLIGAGKAPNEPLAAHFPNLNGTCFVLNEYLGKDVCNSPADILPEIAQPVGNRKLTWHALTGSSFDTSSRYGLYRVSFLLDWGCETVPLYWSHPYHNGLDDPTRMISFQGKTGYQSSQDLDEMLSCMKAFDLTKL